MNKNRYRIIYNKARCMFMAVAENAKSQSKASGQSPVIKAGQFASATCATEEKAFAQLWQVKALLASMSIWMPLAPVYAQIQADSAANAANRPVIAAGKNAAGTTVPVVNIQTPKNGVSHNVYKQFDVLAEGAVLNNSRTGANTKTVGTVAANPFLATGEARVILNEVNSSTASRFEGNLEVAGQMADVIIANPSGINIKGGGFINANKAIFTTGKPQLNADGSIQQFTVNQGKVTFSAPTNSTLGLGGNNNNANYVDVYARAVELNAQLHAKNDIQVIAGANTVSGDLQDISAKTGTGTAPIFAVDVKALGGMYANNIYLMGTEKGLGVSNAGTLKAVNNLVVTSAGKIENSGTLQSTSATQGLVSLQTTQSGTNGNINSSGLINSKSMLSIDAANDLNITGNQVRIDNGVVSPLILSAQGNLNIASTAQVRNLGTNASSGQGDIYIDAKNISAADKASITSTGNISLSATENISTGKASVLTAGKELSLAAQNKLNVTESNLTATGGNINLQTSNSDVSKSNTTVQGATLNAAKDLNLYSSGDLNLTNLNFVLSNGSSNVKNINGYSGRNLIWNNIAKALPQISGKVLLDAENNLMLSSSQLSAKDNIQLQAGQLTLNSALNSQKAIHLSAELKDLVLNQALTAQGDIDIAALVGGITTKNFEATATAGKVSIISNKDLIMEDRFHVNYDSATDWQSVPIATKIKAGNDIVLAAIGQGSSINTHYVSLIAGQDIRLLANKDLNITKSYGEDNYRGQKTIINSANSNIQGNNISLITENGKQDIVGTNITSTGNTEMFSKQNLLLSGYSQINSSKHLALNSKESIYTDNSRTQMKANGILSLIADKAIIIPQADIVGGNVLIESGGNIKLPENYTITTIDSTILKSDAKLKDLNGDLTIQSNAALTLDPKIHKLNAIGDIEIGSTNGDLKILAGLDNSKNSGFHLKTMNGAIKLYGNSLQLQASKIEAKSGIDLIARNGDISLNAIQNTFSDSNYVKEDFFDRYENSVKELKLFKEKNPEYTKKLQELRSSIQKQEYLVSWPNPGAARINSVANEIDRLEKEIVNLNMEYGVTNLYNQAELFFPEYRTLLNKKRNNLTFKNGNPVVQTDNYSNLLLSGYYHNGVDLISEGNVNLLSSKGIILNSSNINTVKDINIYAKGNIEKTKTSTNVAEQFDAAIIFANVKDQFSLGQENGNYYQKMDINQSNKLTGQNINILADGSPNLHITLQGSDLKANENINISGTGNIDLRHSVDNLYTKSQQTTIKRSMWGLKKSRKTETKILEAAIGKGDTLKANKINIESLGGNISLYGTQIEAPKNGVNLKTAKDVYMISFQDQLNEVNTIKKDAGFLGVEYRDSNSVGSKIINTQIPTIVTAKYISSSSGGSTYLEGTQFNFTEGINIKVGDGPNPSPDAKLVITAVSGLYSNRKDTTKKSVILQGMASSGTTEELAKLPKFNGPVNNIKIEGSLAMQVPIKAGDNREAIDAALDLSKQKGYEYLNQIINNKDNNIDWSAFELTKKDWNYKQQGLTPAGAALLVIIVTVITAGTGTATASSVTAATGSATLGTGAQAAVTTLASQASISLINNGGDIGKTLKDLGSKESVRNLAASVVTAGLLNQVSTALNLKSDSTLFSDHLINNFTTSVGSTLVQTGINGGNLSDNLEKVLLAGLAGALQGELASQIGTNLDKVDPTVFEYTIHKIAHAAAGCAAAAATKASCEAGAIGAGVGEIVAGMFDKPVETATQAEKDAFRLKVIGTTKLVSGVVAAYTGYDVNIAASSAELAVTNNYLTDKNYRDLKVKYDGCILKGGSKGTCQGEIDILAASWSNTNDKALIAACANVNSKACRDGVIAMFDGEKVRDEINKKGMVFYNSVYNSFNNYIKYRGATSTQAEKNVYNLGEIYSTFEYINHWQKTNCGSLDNTDCATKYSNYLNQQQSERIKVATNLEKIKMMPIFGNAATVGEATITLITGLSVTSDNPSRLLALAEIASVGFSKYIPQVGPIVHVSQPKYAGQRYSTAQLSQNKDATINPDVVRNAIKDNPNWLGGKKKDPDNISIAVAKVETKFGNENILAVSGSSWSGNAPTNVNINGVNYKVITVDSQSIQPIYYKTEQKTGKPVNNFNHAEAKLFSYIKDTYPTTPSKVTMSIQNTGSDPAGMCNGCVLSSSKYFTNEVPFMNLSIYHGTTGKN